MRRVILLSLFVTAPLIGVAACAMVPASRGRGVELIQDYVSARAWLAGEDPYQGLDGLRARYGFPPHRGPRPIASNPHPPAAILGVAPLSRLPFAQALIAYQVVQVIALALAWNWACQAFARGGWRAALLGGTLGLWAPVWQGLDWGQAIGLLPLLGIAFWRLSALGRPVSSGIILAAACLLRPFLGLASAAWAAWPPRRVVRAVISAAVAVAIGFAITGTTPWRWVRASAGVGGLAVEDTGSLPVLLGLGPRGGTACFAAAYVAVGIAVTRGMALDAGMALAMVLALVTYPLAWFYYDSYLVPAVIWAAAQAHRRDCRPARLALAVYLAGRAIPTVQGGGTLQMGLQVGARASLAIAVLGLEVHRLRSRGQGPDPLDRPPILRPGGGPGELPRRENLN